MNYNESDTKDSITLDFSDEEIIDDNDDEIYSEDELENMNYIQSEDKFYCTLCEFSSNTVEYFKNILMKNMNLMRLLTATMMMIMMKRNGWK